MKIVMSLVFISSVICAGTNWNYDVIAQKGWKVEIICKNGYLVEVITLPNGGKIEESHCYNKSSWNGECNHPPVSCKQKEIK
jgi:hypothetical protein